jgi:hypothetical protein
MTLRSSSLLAAVLSPLLVTSVAGQTVVQPGDSLQAAVAAASPGDVLLVQAGHYVDPVGLVIDKPLTILGAGSAVTTFEQDPAGSFDVVLPLLVQGLAAGETVRVVGLTLAATETVVLPASAVRVDQCAGPVVLADVHAPGWLDSGGFGGKAAVVDVRQSAQVFLDGCEIEAGQSPLGFTAISGGPGLLVVGSSVWINASTVIGGAGGGGFPTGQAANGGVGLIASHSTVRLSRSNVQGGMGGLGLDASFQTAEAGDGALALSAINSSIQVRGGPSNALRGGDGELGSSGGQPDVGAGASAVLLDATSLLTATPDAVIASGLDGDGAQTAPPLDPTGEGTLTPIDQRLATLRVAPTAAQIGGATSAEVAAEPFGLALIGFSVAQSPAFALPGVQGELVLNLPAHGTLPPFGLDAAGLGTFASTLPSSPSLVGVTIVLQGLGLNPSGLISVSPAAFQGFLP